MVTAIADNSYRLEFESKNALDYWMAVSVFEYLTKLDTGVLAKMSNGLTILAVVGNSVDTPDV